jgi:hypothetical protein
MERYEKHFDRLRASAAEGTCPDTEKLSGYLYQKETLSVQDRERIADHLDTCPACLGIARSMEIAAEREAAPPAGWQKIEADLDAKVYAHLDAMHDSAKQTVRTPAQTPGLLHELLQNIRKYWDGLFSPRILAYAVLLVSLSVGGLYVYGYFSRPQFFAQAQMHADFADPVRGPQNESRKFMEGLQAFAAKDFETAIRALSGYVDAEPGHTQALFYLGLAHLIDAEEVILGLPYKFDKVKVRTGVDCLQQVLKATGRNPYLQEDCLWYSAKGYLMLGEVDKAESCLQEIIDMSQPDLLRRQEAGELLLRLKQ